MVELVTNAKSSTSVRQPILTVLAGLVLLCTHFLISTSSITPVSLKFDRKSSGVPIIVQVGVSINLC
jgi:hypothetical protein